MKMELSQEPREFYVGQNQKIKLKDMGQIHLETDEQITLVTAEKNEYDICRKGWGYYATPSINGRLKRFGFKTAWVKNSHGQSFVMLVESKKTEEFIAYLASEQCEIISWMDEVDLGRVKNLSNLIFCPICKSSTVEIIKKFENPPLGENDLKISPYFRELYQCKSCVHLFNIHNYNFEDLYSTDYCEHVYQGKIKETFSKIITLPHEKSDNFHRVQRVHSFINHFLKDKNQKISVLDIGSGLCVFLYQLKKVTDWDCTALDPDPRHARHAQEVCGVQSINQSIFNYYPEKEFSLITLNKVLEHFKYPLDALKKIKSYFSDLKPGYLYLEVPDGEMAVLDSPDREEFFIEHYHGFSYQSLNVLLKDAGWRIIKQARLREPSGKYTLYSFVQSH